MGQDLKAGKGLHQELLFARVLREEADGPPRVDAPHLDLEHRPARVPHPAVFEGRLLVGSGGHKAEFHCKRTIGNELGWEQERG